MDRLDDGHGHFIDSMGSCGIAMPALSANFLSASTLPSVGDSISVNFISSSIKACSCAVVPHAKALKSPIVAISGLDKGMMSLKYIRKSSPIYLWTGNCIGHGAHECLCYDHIENRKYHR